MNSIIRINSKAQLSGKTGKLFFISLLSFILRLGSFALWCGSLVSYVNSSFYENFLKSYKEIFVFSISSTIFIFVLVLLTVFINGINIGEKYIYYCVAEGVEPKLKKLFAFLKLNTSFKAWFLNLRIFLLKTGWLLFLFVPVAIGIFGYMIIYNSEIFSHIITIILSVCISLIFGFFAVMVLHCFGRYDYSVYLFCLNPKLKTKEIIKKSIRVTDSTLSEGVILKYSLFGWFLSIFLLGPSFYAVPYIKLTKASFISHIARERESLFSHHAVNILKIIPN